MPPPVGKHGRTRNHEQVLVHLPRGRPEENRPVPSHLRDNPMLRIATRFEVEDAVVRRQSRHDRLGLLPERIPPPRGDTDDGLIAHQHAPRRSSTPRTEANYVAHESHVLSADRTKQTGADEVRRHRNGHAHKWFSVTHQPRRAGHGNRANGASPEVLREFDGEARPIDRNEKKRCDNITISAATVPPRNRAHRCPGRMRQRDEHDTHAPATRTEPSLARSRGHRAGGHDRGAEYDVHEHQRQIGGEDSQVAR